MIKIASKISFCEQILSQIKYFVRPKYFLSKVAMTRAFTEGMRARGRGHVINISSVEKIDF